MDSATSERVIEALLDQVDELQASSGAAPGLLNGAIYYSSPGLPNPQIVDYYASEVGVLGELYKIQKVVDVMANENRSPEMIAMNADGGVPFLKMSCGTVVAETISICKLIEDAGIGNAKLFGDSTVEKGVVSMWQRRIDGHIVIPSMDHFRWGPARGLFETRGMHAAGQPDAAEGRKTHVLKEIKWLEDLADKNSDFICCNKITIVDIQLFCILNFFMTFDAVGPPCFAGCFDDTPWLKAWHARMAARPAMAASTPSA